MTDSLRSIQNTQMCPVSRTYNSLTLNLTDRVRNEEILQRVKEERNILHTAKRRKANWIGHILRSNCFLKRVIVGKLEGGIEMTGRRGRRRKQLLDDRNPSNDVSLRIRIFYIFVFFLSHSRQNPGWQTSRKLDHDSLHVLPNI